MDIDDSRLYNDKEMEAFGKLYKTLCNLDEKISNLRINLFYTLFCKGYKTEVLEQSKEKYNFDVEGLENKLKEVEELIDSI